MSINIPAETPDESTNPISVEEFERLHPAMLGAIGKAVREELEFPRADDYGSSARMPLRKPNPFNAIFPLIYMATGLVCLILGIRRMERWEILFGLAMLIWSPRRHQTDGCRKRTCMRTSLFSVKTTPLLRELKESVSSLHKLVRGFGKQRSDERLGDAFL